MAVEIGTCSYCLTEDQALLDPSALRDEFTTVIGIYREDDEGKSLGDWMRQDWAMFDHPRMDEARVMEILGDILDAGDIMRRNFSPRKEGTSDALARWKSLRIELMHENRYFPKSGIDLEHLEDLLPHLLLSAEELPVVWCRARIHAGGGPFLPEEMGAPPRELATNGRANPAGIPYLYLASDPTTAISELRPDSGDEASVAEFTLRNGLKVIDLAFPRQTVSPFVLADASAVEQLRADIGFLEQLGDELTRPVLRRAAAVNYTPSQYLCESIKKCGFHGVRYASAVGSGMNLALFRPEHGSVGALSTHRVTRVSIEHENA